MYTVKTPNKTSSLYSGTTQGASNSYNLMTIILVLSYNLSIKAKSIIHALNLHIIIYLINCCIDSTFVLNAPLKKAYTASLLFPGEHMSSSLWFHGEPTAHCYAWRGSYLCFINVCVDCKDKSRPCNRTVKWVVNIESSF